MSKNDDIIEQLRKTKKIANKLLASKIQKRNELDYLDKKVMMKDLKTDEKLYKIFKSLLDPTTLDRLKELDKLIDAIEENIYNTTGWWMAGRDEFRYEDKFVNQGDPEFATHDTYEVRRNESGFYNPSTIDKPSNEYFNKIAEGQEKFLQAHADELERLHELLNEKENIMGGNYKLKDSKNSNLASSIASYLSFNINPNLSDEKKKSI